MLLAIETAATPWGFAVIGPQGLVGEFLTAGKATEELVAQLRAVLPLWQVTPAQLGAIAVVTGPGPYMGVRAGVTVAKTLAQVWDVPVIGLDAAQVLATAAPAGAWVSPVLDVRRGEVYTGLAQRVGGDLEWAEPLAVRRWPLWLEHLARYPEPVLVAGQLSVTMAADLAGLNGVSALPATTPVLRPSLVAREGYARWRAGRAQSFVAVLPFYVRAAVP